MLKVKSIAEVNTLIQERFSALRSGIELVGLEAALNRILAEDSHATEYVPDFDRSTVDGYAVHAADVFGCSDAIPALLNLAGEAHMGIHTSQKLGSNECLYVPTGAEVPQGADTVIMLEYADDLGDNTIAIYKASAPGANMIFRGDDVKPGDVVIPAGKCINTADSGALAAMGISEIKVMRRPQVAIISTGDELVLPGETLSAGKIRDVNGTMLANAVREANGQPHFLGIVEDDHQAVKYALEKALAGHDLVLISGSTSVGTKDAVPQVVSELGEMLVHGVAAKPGKPTIMAEIKGKPVFGLPGNPVAAYFMFYSFVHPLLLSMTGCTPTERTVQLPLSRAVPSNHGREEFVPVMVRDGQAVPIASKSGLITTLSCADGFFRIPRDTEGMNQGEMIQVTLFAR